MAHIIADRVLETTTTTGTNPYVLAGAVTGFIPASAVCSNNDTFDYFAEAVDAQGAPTGAWESGRGTWLTGGTLNRTKIYASSTGSIISWSAGTKRIGITLTANSYKELKVMPHPFMLMGA